MRSHDREPVVDGDLGASGSTSTAGHLALPVIGYVRTHENTRCFERSIYAGRERVRVERLDVTAAIRRAVTARCSVKFLL
ncbi:hypothetical protein GAN18_21890 [Mycobacterium kubicae]|nr:hypothetical protein GAN18_21890 [Mycobacterium kubicae]